MSKQKLISRLKTYYPLERIHAFVTFPMILLYVLYNNSITDVLFLSYGLVICIIILYQGQRYWKVKLFRLTNQPVDQEENLSFFQKSKTLNWVLIGLIPIVFGIQLYLNGYQIKSENLLHWAVLANLAGFLEHVNYYYRQLMIDNLSDVKYLKRNRKLKIASLAKDLRDREF